MVLVKNGILGLGTLKFTVCQYWIEFMKIMKRIKQENLIFKNKKVKGSMISITENFAAKEWKYYKKQEKNINLKTFGYKMEKRCIGIQRFKLYYNLSVLSWHSAMLETEKNIELVLVLFFIFVLPLFFCFWE